MDVEFNLVLPGGGRWILAIRPAPDATALWIATGSLLVSLVVFGLEPALQLTRSRDLRGELAAGVGVLGAPKTRRQRTLLRWQVAISAGFFIVATMFVKYTIAEARHDPGIDLKRLGVAVLNFRTQQWDEARVRRTVDRVVEEARKDQAIEAVSVSTGMPLGLPAMRLTLSQPETAIGGTPDRHNAVGVAATPSLFKTIGVPILRGRGFDDRDHAAAAPVVVLSEFTARRIFGTSDAVGRPVVVEGHGRVTATVIGVARDTDVGYVFGESRPVVYLPLAQRYEPFLAIVARSTGDAAMAVRALRGALRQVDPDLAVEVIGTGRTVLAGASVFLRAAGVAALALGGLTLALAMVGLFGIQSHTVAHRTREIGVRLSLGASPGQIKRMVLKDGYRPVARGAGHRALPRRDRTGDRPCLHRRGSERRRSVAVLRRAHPADRGRVLRLLLPGPPGGRCGSQRRAAPPVAFQRVKTRRMKAFAAALGLAPCSQAQDQPPPKPTFKSAVDLVPVDVNVIDKNGRPVPHLAAGDFTLTVDGKPRRAVSAQFISVDRAVDRVPPSNPMEYNSNTSAQGGRLVMIAVDSNMASAVHARRCHGARGG